MRIEIVWGKAEGDTRKESLDNALKSAGIHNYNLVEYSSVIPAGAEIEFSGSLEREFEVGSPVGVVLARNCSSRPGRRISAGLGLSKADEGGVFMEEHRDATRKEVEEKLLDDLENGKIIRDSWNWKEERTKVLEHEVERVGSVIVAAVFRPLEYR